MNRKRRAGLAQPTVQLATPAIDCCTCSPLSSLHVVASLEQEEDAGEAVDQEQLVPAAPFLNSKLRTLLSTLFPRSTPLSILLLHVVQLEHTYLAPQSAVLHKRRRYHAPDSLLEQILANVQRAIRADDQILTHEGTGAVIIFPDVDRQGAQNILERVYRNISLLQAETVIPPLKRETDILIGVSSYPEPGLSVERLLYYTGLPARRLTLRPAITAHLYSASPASELEEKTTSNDHLQVELARSRIPFMQLPAELPTRLKNLLPYDVARVLRCAPVGRDHHCLTVAMANPQNMDDARHLREVTGMVIFPVSCEVEALDALLEKKW